MELRNAVPIAHILSHTPCCINTQVDVTEVAPKHFYDAGMLLLNPMLAV